MAREIQPGDVIGSRVIVAVDHTEAGMTLTTRPAVGVWAHLTGKQIAHWLPDIRYGTPCGVGVATTEHDRWRTAGHTARRCRRCVAYTRRINEATRP